MEIRHDKEERRFYAIYDDKEYSLEYNEVKDNLWEFMCPYIPSIVTNLKEIEIREKLIETAINYMEKHNIQVLDSGSCFHVRDFLDARKDLGFLIKYIIR
ncbi:MAG TPA: hypothetical protein VIK89_14940 [Cytophagaceae bacterium]